MEATEEHSHEHQSVDIFEAGTVSAYAEAVHQVVTLELSQKGVALCLTYQEALELAEAMEAVRKHIADAGGQAA